MLIRIDTLMCVRGVKMDSKSSIATSTKQQTSPKPSGWTATNHEEKASARPRVLIVGAGFGGINAAHALADKDVDVLIPDRNNSHGFWPLLYQVATAALEPESIA